MKGGVTLLSEKTLIVLEYLKEYFKSNSKLINPSDINIKGLTPIDINIAFTELHNSGLIEHFGLED